MKKIFWGTVIVVIVGLFMEDRLKSASSAPFTGFGNPPSMKENTLYSWKSGDQWYFVLVTKGTPSRSVDEIKRNGIAVRGLDGLKKKLDELPRRQTVVWPASEEGLKFPPESIINQINRYCDSNGLKLEVDRSR